MSVQAVVFMVLIGGLVWGGFTTLVIRAVLSEAAKSAPRERD